MRRLALDVALALLGVGSAAGMPGPRAFAQEATPAPPPTLEGIAYVPLGYLPAVTMPDAVDMEVGRGTLQPGAGFAFTADDPAAGVMIMSAGEMTAVVEDAPWTISRGWRRRGRAGCFRRRGGDILRGRRRVHSRPRYR